jgi:hypothetical protein
MEQSTPIEPVEIQQLIKIQNENEELKNIIKSLKDEIRIQRKEIAVLRDERRAIFDAEKGPNSENFVES